MRMEKWQSREGSDFDLERRIKRSLGGVEPESQALTGVNLGKAWRRSQPSLVWEAQPHHEQIAGRNGATHPPC